MQTEYNVVLKNDFNSNLHNGWKSFGNIYTKTKKDLLGYLSEIRINKDAPLESTHPHLFEKNPTGVAHYLGNPNVKAPHANLEYTPEQLREYKKCMEDPIYFAETYVKVISLDKGLVPFVLYPYQRKMFEDFNEHRFNIVLACRQSGKSISVCAYLL